MESFLFKSKVDSRNDFIKEVNRVLATEQDNAFPVLVQYGMQHDMTLSVAKPIKCFMHTSSPMTHTFIAHYGAGVNNRITLWSQNLSEVRPRKLVKDKKLRYSISKIVYATNHFVYIAVCTDLKLRVLGPHLDEQASFEMSHTVFGIVYCEHIDAFVTCADGIIQVFKLGMFLHDPPYIVKELHLPLLDGESAWVHTLHFDLKTNEMLAICHGGLFFLSADTIDNMCCRGVLENRHSSSMTCAVLYPYRHYVLTGHKDGSIKAWNTAMQRFPLFGSFLGKALQPYYNNIPSGSETFPPWTET
eukprot:gene19055-20969_t